MLIVLLRFGLRGFRLFVANRDMMFSVAFMALIFRKTICKDVTGLQTKKAPSMSAKQCNPRIHICDISALRRRVRVGLTIWTDIASTVPVVPIATTFISIPVVPVAVTAASIPVVPVATTFVPISIIVAISASANPVLIFLLTKQIHRTEFITIIM